MKNERDADNLHLARLTLDRFAAVTSSVRRRALDGDETAGMVADALESVLRRRLAAVLVVQSVPRPAVQTRWWMRWQRRQGEA